MRWAIVVSEAAGSRVATELQERGDIEVRAEFRLSVNAARSLDGLSPDLVFLDVSALVAAALAALRALRERHPTLPVIVVCAEAPRP